MNQDQRFSENDRLAFQCEYADPQAEIIRDYIVFFYPSTQSIEMFDTKHHRQFLKKTSCPNLSISDFQLSTSVYVFGRSLYIRDYADEFTKKKLHSLVTSIPLWVSQKEFSKLFNTLSKPQLQAIRYLDITPSLYLHYQAQLPSECHPGPCFLLLINDTHAPRAFDGIVLKEHIFQTLMTLPRSTTAKPTNPTSLLVIKPHAVLEGSTFPILQAIFENGFQISELQMFTLSKADADDFLEIYNGVLPEYHKLTEELASGPLIAVEVSGVPNPVEALRELCGPNDPTIGTILRPKSLRAKFGKDKVQNAVHCTDLKEDAELESQFFFMLINS